LGLGHLYLGKSVAFGGLSSHAPLPSTLVNELIHPCVLVVVVTSLWRLVKCPSFDCVVICAHRRIQADWRDIICTSPVPSLQRTVQAFS